MAKKSATSVYDGLDKDKQNKVLDAAVKEFSHKGYNNASMNSLTASAGISKGSIFQYFRNKQGLFDFVVSSATNQVKAYLNSVVKESQDKDFFAAIESLLKSGFEFIDTHPYLARIYYQILLTGDAPSGHKIATELNRKAQGFLEKQIITGIERGDLRSEIDPAKTAFLLDSIFSRLLRAYYSDFIAPDLDIYKADKSTIDNWINETISLLRNGLSK